MRLVTRLRIAVGAVGLLAGCSPSKPSADAGRESPPTCAPATQCQRAARTAFDEEMAREGKDCVGVANTVDENNCQAEALRLTERNFATFVSALEGLVGRSTLVASQRAWLSYRTSQCDAIFDFFSRATIAPSAQTRCTIDLTRSRMRDLDGLFEGTLHH